MKPVAPVISVLGTAPVYECGSRRPALADAELERALAGHAAHGVRKGFEAGGGDAIAAAGAGVLVRDLYYRIRLGNGLRLHRPLRERGAVVEMQVRGDGCARHLS